VSDDKRIPGNRRSKGHAAQVMLDFLTSDSDNVGKLNAVLDAAEGQGFDRGQVRDTLSMGMAEGKLDPPKVVEETDEDRATRHSGDPS